MRTLLHCRWYYNITYIVYLDSEEVDAGVDGAGDGDDADSGSVRQNTDEKQSADGAKQKADKNQGKLCCQNFKHVYMYIYCVIVL